MKLSKAKILILLASKGMNISDLAHIYGCSRTRIYTMLNGETVRSATVGKLAEALGVNVTDILEVDEDESD